MVRPRRNKKRSFAGFTLVEVVVALGIFGMAMAALIHIQAESARAAIELRDRTLAQVVAQNALVDLYTRSDGLPNSSVGGTVNLAGGTWEWSGRIVNASSAVRRIDVVVRRQGEEHVLRAISAYKGSL